MGDSRLSIKDPFTAIKKGDLSSLKVLTLNGIDIKIRDKDGSTLLHHAVNNNHFEIIKYLVQNGVNVTQANKIGETVLHTAASKNYFHIASNIFGIVTHEELRKFIDAKTTSGTTALHIACKNGFHNMVILLLSRGANYSVKNKKGKQPVDITRDQTISELLKQVKVNFEQAEEGHEKLYESLEKCSIDEFSAFMNTRNQDGYNLVQIAIINNRQDLATLLQCLKVMLFRSYGHTPTFNAHYYDEFLLLAMNTLKQLQNNCTLDILLKFVRMFIDTFRLIDQRILDLNVLAIEDMLRLFDDYPDATPILEHTRQVIEVHLKLFAASIYSVKLLESTRRKDWILAEKCMSSMAYVNSSDEGGWTPLLHAINAGNIKIVKMLLDHGARVNCATKTGKNTSLHIAVNKGHFEIVELLLEKDSASEFVNAKTDAKGSTALHIASKLGRLDIVMWLLKCRATYCLRNKDGKLPVDLTSDESIEKLLRLIDESFDGVENGNVEVIDKLKTLSDDEFLAVVLCQNENEHLLKDVALANEHNKLADKITDMLKTLLSDKGFKFNENVDNV